MAAIQLMVVSTGISPIEWVDLRHSEMLKIAQDFYQVLGIPYRTSDDTQVSFVAEFPSGHTQSHGGYPKESDGVGLLNHARNLTSAVGLSWACCIFLLKTVEMKGVIF